MPFSECVTEAHKPMCICKEEFHGNGTDVCIPMGFETEDNKRGYRYFFGSNLKQSKYVINKDDCIH